MKYRIQAKKHVKIGDSDQEVPSKIFQPNDDYYFIDYVFRFSFGVAGVSGAIVQIMCLFSILCRKCKSRKKSF